MDDQNISSTAATDSGYANKRSKTSAAWDHFRVEKCGDKERSFCLYCEKNYAYVKGHGTSNLLAHLSKQCKKYPYRFKRRKKNVVELEEDEEEVQFSQEEARKKLASMIIIDEMPFRTVEGEGFIAYSKYLEPRFPSRVTVARDCLKLYENEKIKLKSVLRSHCICLTTDTWTSIQNLNYMCLTAHWIDREWKLHKRILNFSLVPNHKGETIGKMVESCLLEWGIDNIFTITVDNASSNDGAIKYLKKETKHWRGTILGHEFMHVRCCTHILNLVVKEGLEDVHDSIVKIRNAIRYVRSSPSRLQSFKACVEKLKIEHKGLVCLDVETRWNSTYKMLEAAERFEKAFGRLEEDSNYLSYFDKSKNIGPPKKEDWDVARVFVKFLRLFYTVTLRFSGSLYVTSNAFFHELMTLVDRLNTLVRSSDAYLSCMATKMKKKLDKY